MKVSFLVVIALVAITISTAQACTQTALLKSCVSFLTHAKKNDVTSVNCASPMAGVTKTECNKFKTAFTPNKVIIEHAFADNRFIPMVCHALMHASSSLGYKDPASCTSKAIDATKKVCLIIHGSGPQMSSYWNDPSPVAKQFMHYASQFVAYWGHAEIYLKDLCVPIYFQYDQYGSTDANTLAWDDPNTVDTVCGGVGALNPAVIITHSIGGVIVASGVGNHNAGCGGIFAEPKTVHWIDLSSPFSGAGAADWLQKVCADPSGFTEDAYKMVEGKQNCENNAIRPMYKAMQPDYVSKVNGVVSHIQFNCAAHGVTMPAGKTCETIKQIAKTYVDASLCGTQSSHMEQKLTMVGKASTFFSQLDNNVKGDFLGWVLDLGQASNRAYIHDTVNNPIPFDGLVEFVSCSLGATGRLSEYSTSPSDSKYQLHGNHADATLRYGETAGSPSTSMPGTFIRDNTAKLLGLPKPAPVVLSLLEQMSIAFHSYKRF